VRALRSIPGVVWLCALVAFLNAAAWSVWTPPLQSPDEPVHVYYVQYFAETGKVPRPGPMRSKSDEELNVEAGVHRADIVANFLGRPLWTELEADRLKRALDGRSSHVGGGGDAGVGGYPPLYYAALVVPYKLASLAGGDPPDRFNAMRLGSALFAGLTVLFVTMFLRELLPRHRWAWVTGGLACALMPYFAFIAGSVNPDAGIAAASAALFYFVARAFRVGLTPGVAAGLGLATAAAFLTKLSGIGLLPAAALIALFLVFRPAPLERGAAFRGLAIAAACAALPVIAYIALDLTVWDRPFLPSSGGVGPPGAKIELAPGQRSTQGYLTFAWQYAFPQLGFMFNWFKGWAPYDLWLISWMGRFGWGDSGFEEWIVACAGVFILLMLGSGGRALWIRRAEVRRRLPEVVAYAGLAGGLLLLLSWVGYGYRTTAGATFEQGRYLFPLMALWGALIAIGLTGFGRRYGPVAAVTVVLLAVALDFGGVMIMIQRYYSG
jgi:4-amino-4-deoxy-L-arabinose transferase-like glycosyltransferase